MYDGGFDYMGVSNLVLVHSIIVLVKGYYPCFIGIIGMGTDVF